MVNYKKIRLKETPEKIFERLVESPESFFLDSGMSHKSLGKYSFMGFNPFLVFKSKGQKILVTKDGKINQEKGNPFETLELLLRKYRLSYSKSKFPFTCGAVGYFGYDMGYFTIKGLPDTTVDDINVWDCCMGFYDSVLAYDHKKKDYTMISTKVDKMSDERRDLFMEKVSKPTASKKTKTKIRKSKITSNFKKSEYLKVIDKVKDYIRAGDIYQVNLSQRMHVKSGLNSWELYKKLRVINPAPFAAYLNFDDVQVVSASPERFLKVDGRRIETRPIKGTRPRGLAPEEDRMLKKELEESKKDRAENLMIVDLERNDLGRVCEYGTVKVSEFEIIEIYSTVFQMVSSVKGRLRKDVNQIDILKATFPGGSITGAPKVRAMQIIDELEPTRRGIYTGAIGYLSFNGDMDLNIVIRTYILKDDNVYFQVGGGIVADSDPEKEYQETLDKAKALFDALE